MKKKYLPLIFSFFYVLNLFAQAPKGYQAGYYLTNASDTVHCSINLPKSSKQEQSVSVFDNNRIVQLKPDDILGYTILENQLVFESKTITRYGDQKKEGERIFMQLIYRGALNLYRTSNATAQEQFYIENAAEEIKQLKVVKSEANGQYSISKPYLGVLEYMTKDCPQPVKKVKLNTSSLLKFIDQYANCKSASASYQLAKDQYKGTTRFRAVVGLGYNGMVAQGVRPALRITDDKGTIGYEAGFSAELIPAFLRKPVASVVFEAYYTRKGITSEEAAYKAVIDLHAINASISARLYLLSEQNKVRPFIQGGILAGYILNSDKAYSREFSDDSVDYNLFPNNNVNYEVGWLVSAGTIVNLGGKYWEVSLKYAHTLLPFQYTAHTYHNQAYRLNLGIPLN